MHFIQPEVNKGSFTCPNCGAISEQRWWWVNWYGHQENKSQASISVSRCIHCDENTLWINNKMLYPESGSAPFPNFEMPEAVKELYLEAASIYNKSPRGAAALLRLGIQILCKELGENGKNINDDIASLVKKGLPVIVQQSLDAVRVIGNDAVHPGQIDTDNPEIVSKLFELTNIIIEYMIALPKKVSGIYASLPSEKIDGITKRDK